ncbi:MAG: TetR/AcrR family transcriptional regulator [Pseudomonadota bacterium]
MNTLNPPIDGHRKRRMATRERLLAAAKSVMAETRVEAVTIDDLIQKAEVAKGSFYNHFKSKEELFFATLDDIIADLADHIMLATKGLDDPAEALAMGSRLYLKRAVADPEVGRFIVNAPASLDLLKRYADPVVNHTIDKGLRTGRFQIRDRELFFVLLTSGISAVILGLLEEKFTEEDDVIGSELATSVLLLAGVRPEAAHEVAHRPLPIT